MNNTYYVLVYRGARDSELRFYATQLPVPKNGLFRANGRFADSERDMMLYVPVGNVIQVEEHERPIPVPGAKRAARAPAPRVEPEAAAAEPVTAKAKAPVQAVQAKAKVNAKAKVRKKAAAKREAAAARAGDRRHHRYSPEEHTLIWNTLNEAERTRSGIMAAARALAESRFPGVDPKRIFFTWRNLKSRGYQPAAGG